MVHKRETLTKKEQAAQGAFMAKLDIKKRKTDKPVIVAIIGLVGSGKSAVAQELAKHIGATVIEGDDIRIELRKQSERYEKSRAIAENAVLEVVKQGGNVILDSDFVDDKKRASVREKARKAGVHLVFVRTYCDLDVMVGRVLTATYHNRVDDFFGGAKSKWQGSEQSKGAAVKVREMWRRTPHHYRWVNQGGGQWKLKKFPFAIFAEIDTTDSNLWKREVEKCAKQLLTR
ncbi:MAG: AAA family ATPase [Candidatus Niyogibacteria bacterium]|nr:AAA family ATPase [Candidatus Niyogibacteria bacterium]